MTTATAPASTAPTAFTGTYADPAEASALSRLRALPSAERDTLLDMLAALPDPAARQDRLIAERRAFLSPAALGAWMDEARTERRERQFAAFLADIRVAAGRAESFREVLVRAEGLQRVNVALLAARLFDALVARDQPAIERFAHTFAEVVGSAAAAARQGLLPFPDLPPAA